MTESFTESASGLNLAVLGSPIAHSLSPALHRTAYRRLGLDWAYGIQDVTPESLRGFVTSREESWRGLSLTMPLKEHVLPLVADLDEIAALTRAVNTVLFTWSAGSPELRGFNTDVPGIVRAFAAHGITTTHRVTILGGGATARSALVAAADLGAQSVRVLVRDPSRTQSVQELAERVGLVCAVAHLPVADTDAPVEVTGLTISTLPGGVLSAQAITRLTTSASSVILDAAYHPWPSPLAQHWQDAGGTAISGLEMLVQQALLQVRVFTMADPLRHLPDEESILSDMRAAVGLQAPN